jgi:hypothetical protein
MSNPGSQSAMRKSCGTTSGNQRKAVVEATRVDGGARLLCCNTHAVYVVR